MLRSAIDYRELLKGLVPSGKAWNKDPDSILENVLYAMAEELSRLDIRSHDLLDEEEPRLAEELLTEYEEDYGIVNDSTDTEERRSTLYAKQVARGGQYKEYFIAVALALGYVITIEEFTPFWVNVGTGISPCGDQSNIFWWKVHVHTGPDLGEFDMGFDIGFDCMRATSDLKPFVNMVRRFDDLLLEIERLKPGHTSVLYGFYGPSFSAGFDPGFEAVPADDETSPYPSFDEGFDIGFNSVKTYDGMYLTGGFDRGFDLGFDSHVGGGFTRGFDSGFEIPV